LHNVVFCDKSTKTRTVCVWTGNDRHTFLYYPFSIFLFVILELNMIVQ